MPSTARTLDLTTKERKRRSRRIALYNSYSWVFDQTSSLERATYGLWYPTAHAACSLLGQKTGHDVTTVAATVAALSPGTRWRDNIRSAHAGLTGDWESAWSYHAYGGVGIRRAKRIVQNRLTGEDAAAIIEQGRSWKTASFYRSLLLTPGSACVDSWIFRINKLGYLSASPPIGYVREAQSAIRMIASEHDVSSYAVQSILWGKWRKMQNQVQYPSAIDIVHTVTRSSS